MKILKTLISTTLILTSLKNTLLQKDSSDKYLPNFFGNVFSGVRNIFGGAQNVYNPNARQNVLGQNPYFFPQNQNQNRPGLFVNGGGVQTGGFQNQPQSQAGECSGLTSFPPEAKTGCCGKDPSDSDRIIGEPFY